VLDPSVRDVEWTDSDDERVLDNEEDKGKEEEEEEEEKEEEEG